MAVRTIEEITNAMTALVDAASDEDRSLSDDEVTNFEDMEKELKSVQKTEALKLRNAAYNSVVIPAGVPYSGSNSSNNTLELAFRNYLVTGQPNSDISELHVKSDGSKVTNAQGEGVSTSGGYLVPTGFRNKLIEVRKSFGGFIPEAEQLNTDSGMPLEWPTIDDTANSGEITAESATFSNGADLVFGTVPLGAYKYTSTGASNLPIRVPVELLQDSAVDIESLIARLLGKRINRKQARDAVIGNGVGEPQGILAPNLTSDKDLDTPDAPDYEDLVELQDMLDEEYQSNAKWLMRRNTWAQLRLLVDLNGRPLLQTSLESIAGQPKKMLLDHEVVIDENAPLLSSAGDTYPIAYGDFKEAYIWRRVQSLVVNVNPYSRMNNGEVEFNAWERADGVIQNRTAYKIMQNQT